jgi:hypothetical protein
MPGARYRLASPVQLAKTHGSACAWPGVHRVRSLFRRLHFCRHLQAPIDRRLHLPQEIARIFDSRRRLTASAFPKRRHRRPPHPPFRAIMDRTPHAKCMVQHRERAGCQAIKTAFRISDTRAHSRGSRKLDAASAPSLPLLTSKLFPDRRQPPRTNGAPGQQRLAADGRAASPGHSDPFRLSTPE